MLAKYFNWEQSKSLSTTLITTTSIKLKTRHSNIWLQNELNLGLLPVRLWYQNEKQIHAYHTCLYSFQIHLLYIKNVDPDEKLKRIQTHRKNQQQQQQPQAKTKAFYISIRTDAPIYSNMYIRAYTQHNTPNLYIVIKNNKNKTHKLVYNLSFYI